MALVREQGYSVPEAAKSLGIASNMLYRWKEQIEGKVLSEDERTELKQLRKEVKALCNHQSGISGWWLHRY